MRVLVQRVTSARVVVDGATVGQIEPAGQGLLALVGITHTDGALAANGAVLLDDARRAARRDGRAEPGLQRARQPDDLAVEEEPRQEGLHAVCGALERGGPAHVQHHNADGRLRGGGCGGGGGGGGAAQESGRKAALRGKHFCVINTAADVSVLFRQRG